MSKRIGFLGLGNMGEPMARRLLQNGYEVMVVPHRRKEPALRLEQDGAIIVTTPKAAVEGADFVITMLPDLPQIEEVLFGNQGVLAGASEELILINMSTVSPKGIKDLSVKLEKLKVGICDAPVSGGPQKAQNGTLSIMAGADEEIFNKCEEVLAVLGEKVTYTGKLGTGQVVKLCNNMLSAVIMAVNAEVLTMGVKAGVDAHLLREIIIKATGGNWQLENWVPNNILKDQYEAGFALKLMYKDVGLARELGKENGSPMILGNLVHELYGLYMNSELKEKDFSVISSFYQDAANITISDGKVRN